MYLKLGYLIKKHEINLSGIIHFGAHKAEEVNEYNRYVDRVLWIEANPYLEEELRRKVSGYPNNDLVIAAVSDVNDEEVDFYQSSDTQASSLLSFENVKFLYPSSCRDMKVTTLRTSTFESLVCSHQIKLDEYNFINLDVQGAELKVLKGFGAHLDRINYIYTEVNLLSLYKNGVLLHELDKFLYKSNFIREETKILYKGWGDAIYVKSGKTRRSRYIFNFTSARLLYFVYLFVGPLLSTLSRLKTEKF